MKNMFSQTPGFNQIDPYKIHYNVGALLDIPTGTYIKGLRGESILNGGLSIITAVVGRGNTFKSTILHYMLLSAASKVAETGTMPYINTYDTEMSIQLERLQFFADKFKPFKDIDLFEQGIWSVTDKSHHLGNEWFKILKDFLKNEKIKNKKNYLVETPLVDKRGKRLSTIFPTFGEIDSISEFETSDIEDIQNKNEIGDSGGNTIHMRLGLAKTRLLMELPSLCNSSSHYLLMSAHLGDGIPIQAGPYSVPTKKLQHMKMGDKIKGVTEKFFFLPNTVWQTLSTSILMNQNTKGPEYPKTRHEQDADPKDLNLVSLKLLRNKSGPSGFTIDLVISQSEGVLPTLSEFQYIKDNKRFGLEGSNISYNLVLYPEVKLGRTTVRELIDTDPKLRRAIKITSDLLQIKQIYVNKNIDVPSVEDLYAKIKEKYDWNTLLDTRDYWTFNQYEHEVPFLSTMDLINMYHGTYEPYWLKKG
jgi:hypothetical protein